MKSLRLILLSGAVFLAFGCSPPSPEELQKHRNLRYDGVYQCKANDSGRHIYLRFYPDGMVLSIHWSEDPAAMESWLHRGRQGVGKGFIEAKGKDISFTCEVPFGFVDYKGTIEDDELHLDWFSHINGAEDSGIFRFVPWD